MQHIKAVVLLYKLTKLAKSGRQHNQSLQRKQFLSRWLKVFCVFFVLYCEIRDLQYNATVAKASTGHVPNVTTLTTATLLPSCFLSVQEAAVACGVGGRVCEDVSGKGEGVGGHSLSLRQPGARRLGGAGGAHQGHQRANPGGAEEGGVGGAGPPVTCNTQPSN